MYLHILNFGTLISEADLTIFKDTMDLSSPVMAGHSFGGATTLMALAADERFKVGIVLDGWLFPIRDNIDLVSKVKQPVMFVNTESFLNEDNLKKMETFAEAKSERLCYYIQGSVHQNHIDAPFIIRVSRYYDLTKFSINFKLF